MERIAVGTMCTIVARDSRDAKLNGRACKVVAHVEGKSEDGCGDHVIQCGRDQYVTHAFLLRPNEIDSVEA